MNRPHRISVGAIVSRAGKILLVRHRKPGAFDFLMLPGGGVEDGEDAPAAAMREVMEEAAVKVEVVRLAYVEELHILGKRECKMWFFCEDLGGTPSAAAHEAVREGIVSAAFCARSELANKTVYPPVLSGDDFWARLEERFPTAEYLGLRETGM